MALLVRVQPVAGDTVPKNLVDNSDFTGTGSPVLIDEGAEKAWQLATSTLLKAPAVHTVNGNNDNTGITVVMRFKRTAAGTDSFLPMAGLLISGGAVGAAAGFSANGSNAYRGRMNASHGSATTSSKALNTIHTFVWRFNTSSVTASDQGSFWFNQVGRVGTAPDSVSATSNAGTFAFIEAFINCATDAAWNLLDFLVYDTQESDAQCAALADDVRSVVPAPSGGSDVDPPTFTVAPAASAIGQTSATITATINETGSIFWVAVPQGDATPSVAQVIAGQNAAGSAPIDAGSAVGTTSLSEVASGFTAATAYKFCVVAQDDETTPNVQAAVTVVNFTTASAGDTTPPVFTVAPAVTSVSQTTSTVSATIDETGSIFWVVVPNAESTPSVAQVIAGQNAAGGTPTDAGSAVGTTTLSEGVTGMTASTAYKACFVARDDEAVPNVQATVTTVGFTTAAVPTGTFTTGVLRRRVGGGVVANTAMTYFRLYNPTTGALVLNRTDLSSDANGRVTCTDAALAAGVEYKADWLAATGETRMSKKAAT